MTPLVRPMIDSLLCLQLFTGERPYGSLSLNSGQPDAFDAHDEAVALALAAHAAVAIANSHEIEGLTTAVGSHTAIGQAEGILMERFGLDADQAFAVLVRMSQTENRRTVLIAEELISSQPTRTNRSLPGQ